MDAARQMEAFLAGTAVEDANTLSYDVNLCQRYASLGTSLNPNETMSISANGSAPTRIDANMRQSLLARLPILQHTHIDISGRVLAADVRRQRFQLWLSNSHYVDAPFTGEQELQVTEALHSHDSMQLRLRGEGNVGRNGLIESIDRIDRIDEIGSHGTLHDPDAPTVDELIARAFRDVSEEDWAALPTDLAERHDEFVSGSH